MNDIPYNALAVGDTAQFTRTISSADVAAYAQLTGDVNPLHIDSSYAATTRFKKPIVHGMLIAGLFSQLVGVHLPGKRCLYLSQDITFKKPLYTCVPLTITGTITQKTDSIKMLTIRLEARADEQLIAQGNARVQVLE